MNKDVKLLKRYMFANNGDSRYFEINDTSSFPDTWVRIFNASDKPNQFYKEFKQLNIFPKFTEYIRDYIVDVFFVQAFARQYMICKLVYQDGTAFYYGGLNPLLSDMNKLRTINMPSNLNNFYFSFLDGFYDIQFGHIGVYSVADIDKVTDYDFDFLPEGAMSKNYYIFFGNGSGCYVIADAATFESDVIFTDMKPQLNIDFEKEIDDWIYDSLSNF